MHSHYTIEQLEEISPEELGILMLTIILYDNTYDHIKTLVGLGAPLDIRHTKYDWTPLHCAAINDHLEAAKVLIAAGASKEAKDKYGQTPLYLAARWGGVEIIKALLDAGANKYAKNSYGFTPWDISIEYTKNQVPELNPNA